MADEEDRILADARKLPYAERVVHKNWKARSEAYEGIQAACERALTDEDDCFAEFGELLGVMPSPLCCCCEWLGPILLILFSCTDDFVLRQRPAFARRRRTAMWQLSTKGLMLLWPTSLGQMRLRPAGGCVY